MYDPYVPSWLRGVDLKDEEKPGYFQGLQALSSLTGQKPEVLAAKGQEIMTKQPEVVAQVAQQVGVSGAEQPSEQPPAEKPDPYADAIRAYLAHTAQVGRGVGTDAEIQDLRNTAEKQSLQQLISGGNYNGWDFAKDVLPGGLTALAALLSPGDKAQAMGQISGAIAQQISKNADLRQKKLQLANQVAGDVASSRARDAAAGLRVDPVSKELQGRAEVALQAQTNATNAANSKSTADLRAQQQDQLNYRNDPSDPRARVSQEVVIKAAGLTGADADAVRQMSNQQLVDNKYITQKYLDDHWAPIERRNAAAQASSTAAAGYHGTTQAMVGDAPARAGAENVTRELTGGMNDQDKLAAKRAEDAAKDPSRTIDKALDVLEQNIDPETGGIAGVTPERSRLGAGFANLKQGVGQTFEPPTGQAAANKNAWNQYKIAKYASLNDANPSPQQRAAMDSMFQIVENPNASAEERRQAIQALRNFNIPKTPAAPKADWRQRWGK